MDPLYELGSGFNDRPCIRRNALRLLRPTGLRYGVGLELLVLESTHAVRMQRVMAMEKASGAMKKYCQVMMAMAR